jgi:hypothetical protein
MQGENMNAPIDRVEEKPAKIVPTESEAKTEEKIAVKEFRISGDAYKH